MPLNAFVYKKVYLSPNSFFILFGRKVSAFRNCRFFHRLCSCEALLRSERVPSVSRTLTTFSPAIPFE